MLKQEQITAVKGQGFLINRGTELFSGRIVAPGTVFSAQNFVDLAELAEKYGNGKLICTSRLAVEIPGIAYESIPLAQGFAAAHGLRFGGTGAKVRPVTACKGSTCVYGNYDTHALAKKIHEAYYLGWNDVKLPHKFKIAVGGCPNSCMKPSLNDFGVEGRRIPMFDGDRCRVCRTCQVEAGCPSKAISRGADGRPEIDEKLCRKCGVCIEKCPFQAIRQDGEMRYQIFVGGTWGRSARMGTKLNRLATEEEILPLLEKTLLWFKENAYEKERLGKAIDRVGVEQMQRALLSDELLNRKEEILAAPVKHG